jgi:hypothetical protein
MMMLVACTLAAFVASASAAFPGTYTLDAAWPADLSKIPVRAGFFMPPPLAQRSRCRPRAAGHSSAQPFPYSMRPNADPVRIAVYACRLFAYSR